MSELVSTGVIDENPLVTFALFAYNQEKYIFEAIEGAFSQEYSPLQIIISDDCSSDSTYDIMKKMVKQYDGPHEILLNRNLKNIGLAAHINHVIALAKGELIVVAAGDDISYPRRTTRILEYYQLTGYPAVIFSGLDDIENDGTPWLGTTVNQREQTLSEFIINPAVRGATCAWDKEIFTKFPALGSFVTAEDMVLPVRAYLLGRPPKFLEEKLIKYRRDQTRVSKNMAVKLFWQIWPQYAATKQNIIDANGAEGLVKLLEARAIMSVKCYQLKIDFIRANNIISILKTGSICLKLCGAKWLLKLLIIKFGKLQIREIKLIRQDSVGNTEC